MGGGIAAASIAYLLVALGRVASYWPSPCTVTGPPPAGDGAQAGLWGCCRRVAACSSAASEFGLALSLLKRARELNLGGIGLLLWQAVEGRAWQRLHPPFRPE